MCFTRNEKRNDKVGSLGLGAPRRYAMIAKVDLINAPNTSKRCLTSEILVRLVS
jgi:hypothetical protein